MKFLGNIWSIIEYNGEVTKLPILITQRNDITPLLGVNWLKRLPVTINNYWTKTPANQKTTTQKSTNCSKQIIQLKTRK